MDDLISRQVAIDEAVAYIEEWNNAKSKYHKKEITKRFQNLPSVEPRIICCKDCKHGEPGACGYGIDCDGVWHNDNWFCADGERKKNDGTN